MIQIVLIRPGSTDYDQQGRIQGTLDIPLNEQGTQEVQRTIRDLASLGIDAVYSGPCQAGIDTATAIADAVGAKMKKLDTLRNIDHGLWQGMLVEDVKHKHRKVYRQWQEQPETVCPPEGETAAAALQRVQEAIAKLIKKYKQGTIALVVPEPLASVIHGYLSGCELGEHWKTVTDCGKWNLISLEPKDLVPSEH
jgi:phosphoserine phosphatase